MSIRDQLQSLMAFAVNTDYLGTTVIHRLPGQDDVSFAAVIETDMGSDMDDGPKGYSLQKRMTLPTSSATLIPHRSQIIVGAETYRVTAVSAGECFTTAQLVRTTRQNVGDGRG